MLDKIGGRKLIASLIVLATGIGVVLLKGDVPPNFNMLLQVIFGAFVAGNIGEHVAGAISAPAEPQASNNDVESALSELKALNEQLVAGNNTTQQALSFIIDKFKK